MAPLLGRAGRTLSAALRSLRAKIVALLATAVSIAALAAALVAYGMTTAEDLILRTQTAQSNLEHMLLLAGRVNDYGLTAIDSVGDRHVGRVEGARTQTVATFDRLGALIAEAVAAASDADHRSAVATKGLVLARMRAQFLNLDRQVVATVRAAGAEDDRRAAVRSQLDAFGVGFSPMLAQAIEDERRTMVRARDEMETLSARLVTGAVAGLAAAAALAFALYHFAGRPLIERIAETVRGAGAISAGDLAARLRPSGRDELTLLMVRFNRMASNLNRREAALLAAQADLQQTIDRQTADLRQANARLEAVDANRRRFFSDISHELRTPLTVIQGEAEFNLRGRRLPPAAEVRASFATVLARARDLRRRVDDMLRVARSQSGRLDLDRRRIDLRDVVTAAVEPERRAAGRRGVTLSASLPDRPVPVDGDPDWLRQVVAGLLDNAFKHGSAGGAVAVALSAAPPVAVVAVHDDGEGIADADLAHVFERFRRSTGRVGPPAAVADGFGIGLSLARWVVAEHAGTIAIANNPGRGVTVTVTLPLADAEAPEAARP